MASKCLKGPSPEVPVKCHSLQDILSKRVNSSGLTEASYAVGRVRGKDSVMPDALWLGVAGGV